jgi:hypothetical protein
MSKRTDHGPIFGSGWTFLASTIVLMAGVVIAIDWWKNPLTRQAGLIALAIGMIPWLITIVRLLRLRRAVGTADLHFDDSVPLGFSGTATYVRPLRGAELLAIEARLQCEEEIVKGGGKQKSRIRKIVYDEPLTPAATPAMERMEVRIPVKIPAGGPSTMWCEEAHITWWIRLKLRMAGCPNTASSFQIHVLPAVVER